MEPLGSLTNRYQCLLSVWDSKNIHADQLCTIVISRTITARLLRRTLQRNADLSKGKNFGKEVVSHQCLRHRPRRVCHESQRDSILQPRIARSEPDGRSPNRFFHISGSVMTDTAKERPFSTKNKLSENSWNYFAKGCSFCRLVPASGAGLQLFFEVVVRRNCCWNF